MKFRLGLIIGFAIGYVLGAKAGKERYQQIVSAYRSVAQTDTVRTISDQVRSSVADGMHATSRTLRDHLDQP